MRLLFTVVATVVALRATPKPLAPAIEQVFPQSLHLGETADVLIEGNYLDGASSVRFDSDRLSGRVLESSFTRARIRVVTRPEADAGLYSGRIETRRGVTNPWAHQADAAEHARAGRHVVVATGTASGKSLAYLMPALTSVLEGTLARVSLLGTAGFADLIEIGRQNRPSLADHFADRPPPLVARRDRLDVPERMSPTGEVKIAPEAATLPDIPGGVEALAVCFLHSDLNPKHEELVAQAYREVGWDVTASHELSPLFREYERASTTVMNAALRPRVRRYLEGLAPLAERLWVMTSAGGLWPLGDAAAAPAGLALSGPAGGVRAAAVVASACGFPDAISFDMGGTSTDVCLILDGDPAPARRRKPAKD